MVAACSTIGSEAGAPASDKALAAHKYPQHNAEYIRRSQNPADPPADSNLSHGKTLIFITARSFGSHR
jgi:hypothetical protein